MLRWLVNLLANMYLALLVDKLRFKKKICTMMSGAYIVLREISNKE